MLSRRLAPWLGPDAHLLDSRAYLRRLSRGKRCSVELELVVGRANGVPAERRRLLGKLYREDQGATVYQTLGELRHHGFGDRKSTRLNSSHRCISYAVFCLKKKNQE